MNVGGHRKVPMAELRAVALEGGLKAPRTYVQSGNLVVRANGSASGLEAKLEEALTARFGFAVAVLARSAADWTKLAAANPFLAAAEAEPSRVMMLVSKAAPRTEAALDLLARATAGERVAAAPGAVWIHYPEGAGKSKLSPALVDRLVGSKVTARNWRTVEQLREMASVAG